jgi:hypothetical protein
VWLPSRRFVVTRNTLGARLEISGIDLSCGQFNIHASAGFLLQPSSASGGESLSHKLAQITNKPTFPQDSLNLARRQMDFTLKYDSGESKI